MCSFATQIGLEGLGHPEVVNMWSLTNTHTHTHISSSISKCSIKSVVYPESQDCSRKAPWDSLSAAKVSKASSWPNVNTPESVLAWLHGWATHWSLAREAFCFLAFSFSFSVLWLLLSHPDAWTEVCERMCSSVYMLRCAAHMRKAAEGYLCFLIFFIVFDMLSWSSRSRSWIISQMDTSDLLIICPITAYPIPEEKPAIVLAQFLRLCNVIRA